jgi:hypothetical protein
MGFAMRPKPHAETHGAIILLRRPNIAGEFFARAERIHFRGRAYVHRARMQRLKGLLNFMFFNRFWCRALHTLEFLEFQ